MAPADGDDLDEAQGAVRKGEVAFGRAATDYNEYRAQYPAELFDRLEAAGIGFDQGKVLDIGTGTGFLASALARRGYDVVGLDVDSALLVEAQRADAVADHDTAFLRAVAEHLPIKDGTVRVITAGQCWHWFDRDRAATAARRALEPGGDLVITHFDWLPLPGSVVEATEELILEWNPDWRGSGRFGFYPNWARDVRAAGIADIETFTFDVEVPFTHEEWRGRIRASAGVGGALNDETVMRFDAALAELLAEEFPADPLDIPHRSFTLMCRAPP